MSTAKSETHTKDSASLQSIAESVRKASDDLGALLTRMRENGVALSVVEEAEALAGQIREAADALDEHKAGARKS